MVTTKSVRNVLRMVSAGKDPADPGQAPGVQPTSEAVERSYILYMYYAPEDKAINFPTISDDLKNSAKRGALVKNLMSKDIEGITDYSAGYFSWQHVFVVTNRYDKAKKKYIVYSARISPMGMIVPGEETIIPDTESPTTGEIRNTFNIFKSGILNLLPTSPIAEVFYRNEIPPANFAQHLLTNPAEATEKDPNKKIGENYNEFVKKMDQFRIWTGQDLIRPDFVKASNDGVPGNYYRGGKDAFDNIILPLVEDAEKNAPFKPNEPEKPSLGEKTEEQGEKEPLYEPVTKTTEPVRGNYLDTTPGGARMAAQDINLVRRVMLGYLKGAAYSQVAPSTSPSTTTTTTKKRPSVPISDVPEENDQSAKVLQDYARDQKKMEQRRLQLQKSIGQRAQQMGAQS